MYIVASASELDLGVILAPGGAGGAACSAKVIYSGCWYGWRIVEVTGREGGPTRLGDAMDARTGENHYLEMCWSKRRRGTCVSV